MQLPIKVLLYCDDSPLQARLRAESAFEKQRKALELAGVEYTLNSKENFDILHMNTVSLSSSIAIDEARRKGARIIYHAHAAEEDYRAFNVFFKFAAPSQRRRIISLYSKADCILVPTPHVRNVLKSYGIEKPVFVVSSGVDFDKFKKSYERERIFRNRFGISDNQKVVICSGGWHERKGVFDFIDIAKDFPDVRFIWFGSSPLSAITPEMRRAIMKKHPDNVLFAGRVQGDAYYGAFSAADAFLFPSYEETEALAVSEAMASQTPVLARNIPSYESWLENGKNCILSDNNSDFKKNLRSVLQKSPSLIVRAGYELAKTRSLENTGNELKKIYKYVFGDDTVRKIREYLATKPENKLSIGLFTDTFTPDVNGVSVSVQTLKTQLEKMGHKVYVITPTVETKLTGVEFYDGILRMPAIKLKQLYGYRLSRPYSIRATRYIKEMHLDVCHINTEFSARMFATAVSSMYDIPVVSTYHTMYEDYTHYVTHGHLDKVSKKIVGWYTKILFEKKGEIIVPSKKTAETLKRYGITKHLHIVPTGIDTERFSPENIDKNNINNIRREFGIEKGFVLSYVGRIAPEKGLENILKALPTLFEQYRDMFMLVVGYGPSLDSCQQLVKDLMLDDRVFFTGKVFPDKIQDYYAASDVFVTASNSETQGITYIEAMGAGIPVIAKYDKCVEDILIEGKTGFYFDTNEELHSKILRLYDMNNEERLKISDNCLEKAKEFSLESFGKNVLDVYYQAIVHNKRVLERKSIKKQNRKDFRKIIEINKFKNR